MSEQSVPQPAAEAPVGALAGSEEPAEGSAGPSDRPRAAAKVYDFRRPDKFSREHLRALRAVHQNFGRSLAASVTSYLRTSFQVRLSNVEQTSYQEYIRALPSPTVLFILAMPPLAGQAVLELSLPMAGAILDRLLGGSGRHSEGQAEVTEIEMALLETVGGFITASLQEAWENVVPIEPSVQPVFTPEFVQVTLPAETVVLLSFEVTLLSNSGTLSICLPHPMLQGIMEKLTAQMWFTGGDNGGEDRGLDFTELLDRVPVPVVVELGRADLAVADLMDLAPGQIMRLNTSARGSLPVRVGETVKFRGRPGLSGRNLAVEIVQILN